MERNEASLKTVMFSQDPNQRLDAIIDASFIFIISACGSDLS